MTQLLFIGDVVGEAGLSFLEGHLPNLIERYRPDVVIANAENLSLTGANPVVGCGMTPEALRRLFALSVDLVTGGNHSWDGPRAEEVHRHPGVLRPHNYSPKAPGRGACILQKNGFRLGVVNLASRTALLYADQPYDVLEGQLDAWRDKVDAVVVDFHGESVSEKQIFAFSFAGRVAAVLGTHTHVPTLDAQLLPGGTAYVTDVGMTGPSGGMQGYDPAYFVEVMRRRLPNPACAAFAEGPVQLGAVLVTLEHNKAVAIERIPTPEGGQL